MSDWLMEYNLRKELKYYPEDPEKRYFFSCILIALKKKERMKMLYNKQRSIAKKGGN